MFIVLAKFIKSMIFINNIFIEINLRVCKYILIHYLLKSFSMSDYDDYDADYGNDDDYQQDEEDIEND